MTPRPRVVAFFLPQFHAIPENDEWWGKGFTEWTNTSAARPLFYGHDHPRTPFNGHYFDLTDAAELRSQALAAREHGIDAFCMYFYWFNGHRLLERPVNTYAAMHDAGLPFCLSWANENWTRRWDGKDSQVLMAQDYTPETPAEVYQDLREYFSAPHYLTHEDRPILLVHRTDLLPDALTYAREWNRLAKEDGYPGLYLVAAETRAGVDPREWGFDAVAEFPPVTRSGLRNAQFIPPPALEPRFKGRLLSYARAASNALDRPSPSFVRHRGVMPGWDNTARRGLDATIYVGHSPERYRDWLAGAIAREAADRGSDGLVFVNAWNEWAEGAYLQPDLTHGTAYLRATAEATSQWASRPQAQALGKPDPSPPSSRPRLHLGHARSLANAAATSAIGAVRRARAALGRTLRRRQRR